VTKREATHSRASYTPPSGPHDVSRRRYLSTSVGPTTATTGQRGRLGPYGALWSGREELVRRYHLDLVAIAVLVVVWVAIRTAYGDTGGAYLGWVFASAALTLVSPRAGLILYIATGAFFDNVKFAGTLSFHDLLIPVLALSVGARMVVDGGRTIPRSAALLLGVLVAVGTLAGVVHSVLVFHWASHFALGWVATIGGAMIILVSTAWVARKGDVAPLITAVVIAVVVAVIALAEYAFPGLVSGGPLGWLGFWKNFAPRLAGIIPSPNGLAAQLVGPAALLLVALVFARDSRLRLAAAIALVPLVMALYLTYSRSPIVALVALVVIASWRVRRTLGMITLIVAIVIAAVVVPPYVKFRGGVIGEYAQAQPGQTLIASDQMRVNAWTAALRMLQDRPLTGQGFLAYKLLADDFGDHILGSPHNEWLRLFAEEGALVGLLGLAFIALTMRDLGRLHGWRGTAFLSAFASIVLAASFNNPFLFLQVSAISYAIVGTGLALAARSRNAALERKTAEYTRRTT
jgi:O-antigen ligase/polysaccharide polymerase Wzy-like membrane protein